MNKNDKDNSKPLAKNWRAENLAKARQAKIAKTKMRELEDKVTTLENLPATINDNMDIQLEEKVRKLMDETDIEIRKLKSDFYEVFYNVGGVSGMVNWIKRNKKNRLEFYKLFIALLKTETVKAGEAKTPEKITLNIITPGGQVIVDGQQQ